MQIYSAHKVKHAWIGDANSDDLEWPSLTQGHRNWRLLFKPFQVVFFVHVCSSNWQDFSASRGFSAIAAQGSSYCLRICLKAGGCWLYLNAGWIDVLYDGLFAWHATVKERKIKNRIFVAKSNIKPRSDTVAVHVTDAAVGSWRERADDDQNNLKPVGRQWRLAVAALRAGRLRRMSSLCLASRHSRIDADVRRDGRTRAVGF